MKDNDNIYDLEVYRRAKELEVNAKEYINILKSINDFFEDEDKEVLIIEIPYEEEDTDD